MAPRPCCSPRARESARAAEPGILRARAAIFSCASHFGGENPGRPFEVKASECASANSAFPRNPLYPQAYISPARWPPHAAISQRKVRIFRMLAPPWRPPQPSNRCGFATRNGRYFRKTRNKCFPVQPGVVDLTASSRWHSRPEPGMPSVE
jgi:hypothetical protein